MDTFIELLVKKRKKNSDRTKQSLILAAAVLITVLILYFGMFYALKYLGSVGSLLVVAAGFGLWYGVIKWMRRFNVEYEYIFTNGELDVDKIMGKAERVRLLTVEAKDFSEFGQFNTEIASKPYDTRIMACRDEQAENNYYAVFEHKTHGKTLLVITPNDEFLGYLSGSVPARAKNNHSF